MNLKDLKLESLRGFLGVVPQDCGTFKSIKKSIKLYISDSIMIIFRVWLSGNNFEI